MSTSKKLTAAFLAQLQPDMVTRRSGLNSTHHLDDVRGSGLYTADKPQGLPTSVYPYGLLAVFYAGSRVVQVYFPDAGQKASDVRPFIWRIRIGEAWGLWRYADGTAVT